MRLKNVKKILEKVENGNFTHEEEQVAKRWLLQLNQNKDLDFSDEKLINIGDRIWLAIEQSQKNKRKKYSPIDIWPHFIAIAASLAIIITALYFLTNRAIDNDVVPGQFGATLTLASGKKIHLSKTANGEIANDGGVIVKKTADGELVYNVLGSSNDPKKLNKLSTAKGETYILMLPDRSKVYLNSASSITYAVGLNLNSVRKVQLDGEAYFEVFKDKKRPFIVNTGKQQIQVLGTHFNVNSYADESLTITTLLEGSVSVSSKDSRKILKPGQQAISNGEFIKISKADIESVIDWKNGGFLLNRIDFRTAMRKISRWYDVEVIYDESVPVDLKSSGYISRTKKLSNVLKSIEKSGQVHFRIDGRKIYVFK